MKALAEHAVLPLVHQELKDFELHRMLTQKVAALFLPDLPVKSRPVGGGRGPASGGGSGRAFDPPPDQHRLLDGFDSR